MITDHSIMKNGEVYGGHFKAFKAGDKQGRKAVRLNRLLWALLHCALCCQE